MSDSRVLPVAGSPWLRVRIDHRFAHGLAHEFASFHLNVSFTASATRTVVFGPSGSGKSSLLRAVAGLLEPDAGKIELHGQTAWERHANGQSEVFIPPEKRRVGLVMQSPAIFPHLTVARNIAFALRGMEKSAQRERIFQLLGTVGAEALADRWPRELSGGQQQRVAIARTLAAEPGVLLMDEPFAALDAKSRQVLSEKVQGWARERSVPVLAVTHNLEEAFAAGDEVLVIDEGRITAQGTPDVVLSEERERLLLAMGAAAGVQPET
ncbi:MAG: ATP-binding cassette domain-containing protein [Acidobacteriaceae bacterium]